MTRKNTLIYPCAPIILFGVVLFIFIFTTPLVLFV
ncbi:hypothetical protein CKO_01635 [Citrobacter koseri ATCC BAA-895]|uniref:Uncharacterized protein n=1 Tax=Citrobacter koseri (strain ATCC BAA-895 / CDC 4225-83 / SGSC4696) TaxID=290338 RepID=A8AH04_CITK8|nr:hypothetical protein CKO_01635 [Citrobacter koseri ATCC BAA-895]